MNKATEEDVKKSINYFERSIERDPDFALAYSGLADTYRFLTAPGLIPPREGMAMIKELAQKSIELDSTIAEPHTSLGWVLYWIEWNWKEAEKELKLALKLNPNSVRAHVFYAHYLYFIKSCFDEPRGHLNQAIILDPVSFEARKASIILYYCEGLYDKAHMEIGKVKEFNKYSAAAYWLNFNVYMKQRKYRPAVDELKHFMSIDTTTIKHNEIIEAVYEQSGIKGVFRWFIEIDELEMSSKYYAQAFFTAQKYAFLDEKEKALELLEKSLDMNTRFMITINKNFYVESLHSEPRFIALLRKIGLKDTIVQ